MSRDRSNKRVARGSTLYSGKASELKKRRLERLASKTEREKNNKYIKPATNPIILKKIPDEQTIDVIVNFLSKNGIQIKDYKRNYIIRRLRARVTRKSFSTYREYYNLLTKDKDELEILKKSLSINVTRFFRNKDTFAFVRKEVLPKVVEKAKNNKIHIWSAGSAVGAEAYSISMMMSDLTQNYTIQGSDIKDELLELARGALYDTGYIAEMTNAEKNKYFDSLDSKTVKVKPFIKNKVSFNKLDLLKDKYPKNMDIIFCRNVLIYFERSSQKKIIDGFVNSLKPGGFLVLGRTESIFSIKTLPSLTSFDGRHRVYRKKDF